MPPPHPRRRTALPGGVALAGGVALVVLWAGTWLVNRSLVAVRGPSMLPTLPPGQRLLTVPARGRRLRVGDVVVVEDPREPGHLVVKRVARVEGTGPRTRVLVLGDNPPASTDGRHWGPLPAAAVRRRVVARWPPTRPGRRVVARWPVTQPGRRARSSSSGSSSATSPAERRP